MNTIELFNTALEACERYRVRYPEDPAILQIVPQLQYLVGLAQGTEKDRSRVAKLTIGVLTVREIAPMDEQLALLLDQVMDVVWRNWSPPGKAF